MAVTFDDDDIKEEVAEQEVTFKTDVEIEKEILAPLKVEETDTKSFLQKEFDSFLSTSLEENANKEENQIIIPTGLDLLDTILGGGVSNKLTLVCGNPGSCKSALATRILANTQKRYKNFIGIYLDSESTMSMERLSDLGVHNIRPREGITVEAVFKIIDRLCAFKANNPETLDTPSIIVWDSIANTPIETVVEEEEINLNATIGLKARLLSALLPKYIMKLSKFNICFLCVNQLRDKLQMGPMKTAPTLKWLSSELPGGKSLLFNSFQLVHLAAGKDSEEYGFNGLNIKSRTIKSKMFSPNLDVNLVFSFKNGFSNFFTNYNLLKDEKKIAGSAFWKLESLPVDSSGNKISFRQKDVLRIYKTNPEFKAAFDKDVKEILDDIIKTNRTITEDFI